MFDTNKSLIILLQEKDSRTAAEAQCKAAEDKLRIVKEKAQNQLLLLKETVAKVRMVLEAVVYIIL